MFLESAGNPDARPSDDLEGAVGLTQILAGTASSLLGMHVDVAASQRLTRRMERRGPTRAPAAKAPRRSTSASTRARRSRARLATSRSPGERFGREDLAVVSYHMGIGNLESVLDAYGDRDASWARVYFDATPLNHPRAYRR